MRVSVRAVQPVPHRAVLAPVWEFSVRSARYDDTEYTVRLLPDGNWACAPNCPAYSYGSRLDGECRHIDIAREERERRMTLAFLLC